MKKTIPLSILQVLQPFATKHSSILDSIPVTNSLFKLKDKDKKSDFYFEVLRQELSQGNWGYIIEYKPANNNNIGVSKQWTKIESVIAHAENWIKIVEQYNSIETIYDDPVEKQYQQEFYNDFKIVDNGSKLDRFNFSQQLLLLSYIETIETYINNDSEFTQEEKHNIQAEVSLVKQDIGTETKDEYILAQSKLWAKIRKASIKACDFVIKEFAKVVIKQAAEKGVTISWNALPHYIEKIQHFVNSGG